MLLLLFRRRNEKKKQEQEQEEESRVQRKRRSLFSKRSFERPIIPPNENLKEKSEQSSAPV